MEASKKEQMEAMLAMLQLLSPDIKSLEQIEAEAAECEADPRSFCAGYFQGVRDGIEVAQDLDRRFGRTSIRTVRQSAPEPRDITNLWGLIP